jgi:hypothetical protein
MTGDPKELETFARVMGLLAPAVEEPRASEGSGHTVINPLSPRPEVPQGALPVPITATRLRPPDLPRPSDPIIVAQLYARPGAVALRGADPTCRRAAGPRRGRAVTMAQMGRPGRAPRRASARGATRRTALNLRRSGRRSLWPERPRTTVRFLSSRGAYRPQPAPRARSKKAISTGVDWRSWCSAYPVEAFKPLTASTFQLKRLNSVSGTARARRACVPPFRSKISPKLQ